MEQESYHVVVIKSTDVFYTTLGNIVIKVSKSPICVYIWSFLLSELQNSIRNCLIHPEFLQDCIFSIRLIAMSVISSERPLKHTSGLKSWEYYWLQ